MQTDLHKRIGCGKQAPTPFGFELYVLRFGDVSVVLHMGGARGGMTARRHAQWVATANIIPGFCVAAAFVTQRLARLPNCMVPGSSPDHSKSAIAD